MNTREESDYWYMAAVRKDQEGEHATATSFRNLAWLLEHRTSWLEFVAANFPELK